MDVSCQRQGILRKTMNKKITPSLALRLKLQPIAWNPDGVQLWNSSKILFGMRSGLKLVYTIPKYENEDAFQHHALERHWLWWTWQICSNSSNGKNDFTCHGNNLTVLIQIKKGIIFATFNIQATYHNSDIPYSRKF